MTNKFSNHFHVLGQSTPETIIKQWGLQRSGTNLTQWMLEKHFKNVRVYSNAGGWKYAVPSNVLEFPNLPFPNNRPPDYHIITIKNPYSWFYSFKQYSLKKPPSLYNFPIFNEIENNTTEIIKLWNDYTIEYLDWVSYDSSCMLVKYEDLVFSTDKVMNYIQQNFGLAKNNRSFALPDKKVDPDGKGIKMNISFVHNQEYMSNLSKTEKLIIKNIVSQRIMSLYPELIVD